MTTNYTQREAIAGLLRGETIPADWMAELAKVTELYLYGNQIIDPSGLAALKTSLFKTRIIR